MNTGSAFQVLVGLSATLTSCVSSCVCVTCSPLELGMAAAACPVLKAIAASLPYWFLSAPGAAAIVHRLHARRVLSQAGFRLESRFGEESEFVNREMR